MGSKQLNSILNTIPSATAEGERKNIITSKIQDANANKIKEENERIVAVIPKILKDEIKNHIQNHKGETERIIILKALKLLGFNVKKEWLIDKRSTR